MRFFLCELEYRGNLIVFFYRLEIFNHGRKTALVKNMTKLVNVKETNQTVLVRWFFFFQEKRD